MYRARHLRNHDRHISSYPDLHYPNICVLDGGFSEFYQCFKQTQLAKGSYIEMKDKAFEKECKMYSCITASKNATKLRRWNSESVLNTGVTIKKFPSMMK